MKRFLLTAALAAAFACHAQEPDKRTPLEKYQGQTAFALLMCPTALRIANASAEMGKEPGEHGDWRKCQIDQRAEAKRMLDAALKGVRKPAAHAALKTHYVAFIAALDGITPARDELKISYQARQAALKDKLNEAWARFEVEQ
jgi:hypothetical protein